jgi:hypothetical protein
MLENTTLNATFVTICSAMSHQHGIPLPKRMLELGSKTEGWGIAINLSEQTEDTIAPFTALVFWNGFPAGIIHPYGGILAAGKAANQLSFLEWLKSFQGTSQPHDAAPST